MQESLQLGINLYQEQLNKGYTYSAIPLDCSKLPDTISAQHEMQPEFFGPLHSMFSDPDEIKRRACLYIMEVVSPDVPTIVEAFLNYRNSPHGRNPSAIKKHANTDASTLYIGKVKSGIGGRIASHLGYASPGIGALQLVHWAKAIDLRLLVHVYAFEASLGDFINPLELTVTKDLKPLIGKSK